MFKRFPFIHNHGDFVHLDALRDWLRGVVSLETFLKSKDDKAIIKDMHFTDERTTVDYIDTKDDTEKSEVLCKYLTSDFFRLDDRTQFKKAEHIRFKEYPNNEKVIAVRDKETGEFRDVIRSNCPIAYEATNDYMTSNKAVHIGIYDNGIKIYDDSFDKTSLLAKKDYQFCSPIAYNATDSYKNSPKCYYLGVNNDGITVYKTDTKEVFQKYVYGEVKRFAPENYRYFTGVMDATSTSSPTIDFTQTYIEFFAIKDKVISAQAKVHFTNSISIASGGYKVLRMITSGNSIDNITSDFINSEIVFPKSVRCSNNTQDTGKFVITSINQGMQNNNLPITNGDFYISIYNPTNQAVTINDVVIAY